MSYMINLISDDVWINKIIALYTQQEGWDLRLINDISEAGTRVHEQPDLWIFNLEKADQIDYEVIAFIKMRNPLTSIIMVTPKISASDRLLSLELGVDDIIEKPFVPKELIIRSTRLIGKSYGQSFTQIPRQVLKFQNCVIDTGKRTVKQNDCYITLTSKEFDLMYFFAHNAGLALSRDQILMKVWGNNNHFNTRMVDDLVKRVRRKVKPIRIETIYGYGYRACK